MKQVPSPLETFALMGEATALLAESPLHQSRSISEIGALILPPLMRNQLRIWRRGALPIGIATWAWLDDATEEAVLHQDHTPLGDEWNCGPNPVVIDFIAPFGDGFAVARDLKRSVFPDRALRSVRRDATGKALRVVQHPGRDQHGNTLKAAATAA